MRSLEEEKGSVGRDGSQGDYEYDEEADYGAEGGPKFEYDYEYDDEQDGGFDGGFYGQSKQPRPKLGNKLASNNKLSSRPDLAVKASLNANKGIRITEVQEEH